MTDAEPTSPWQPIATAPKDRKIDLLYPYPRGRTIDCYWSTGVVGGWCRRLPTWDGAGELLPEDKWQLSTYPRLQPTHWMESPVLPPRSPDDPSLDVRGVVTSGEDSVRPPRRRRRAAKEHADD